MGLDTPGTCANGHAVLPGETFCPYCGDYLRVPADWPAAATDNAPTQAWDRAPHDPWGHGAAFPPPHAGDNTYFGGAPGAGYPHPGGYGGPAIWGQPAPAPYGWAPGGYPPVAPPSQWLRGAHPYGYRPYPPSPVRPGAPGGPYGSAASAAQVYASYSPDGVWHPYGAYYRPEFYRRHTNALAIAALVLGLVWFYFIGSVAAIIFGHVALKQIKQTGEPGRGLAIGGIVLGWIGVLALIATIAVNAAH